MEATLLSSLYTKLDDLEGRMRAYRYDLITDFQRYYHDLLTGVNPSVATSIQRAIAPSFANYPTLRPELEAADSQPPDRPQPATFQPAATPEASPRTEAPKSSREREIELQGLFTPSYLPLLENSPPHNRRAVPATISADASTNTTTSTQTTVPFPLLPVMEPPVADVSTAPDDGVTMGGLTTTGNDTTPAGGQAPAEAHRLVRTATEDSTSSVCSDKSDSKVMRSAMRRSSSISKPPQSPRRVRFEFMGAEVLPTSSPQQVEFITPFPAEPAPEDEPIASDMMLGDDVEEWQPPPRKSSSTEALRALSRAPAEEGTVWTVVNPETDGANSQKDGKNGTSLKKPNSIEQTKATTNNQRIDISAGAVQSSNKISLDSRDVHSRGSGKDGDAGNSSDDEEDYLAMGKRNTSANQKSTSPSRTQLPTRGANNGYSAAAHTLDKSRLKPNVSKGSRNPATLDDESLDDYGDDDDLFEFEPGGLSAPPKPREKPTPPPDEDEDESLDDESQDEVPSMAQANQQSLYSTSPAVPIMRPQRTENSMSTVSRFQPGSLGSYKGRPVIMPVVRNAEVHARAASLGQFNTFVGGLDGRSGMDEGDLSSFRASVVQPGFSGTPRSFTERYMMEEAQAEREKNEATQ